MRTVLAWTILCVSTAVPLACAAAAPLQDAVVQQVSVSGSGGPGRWRVLHGGNDVPLRVALRSIVPADYSINLPNAGAWASTRVSWHAGGTLEETLQEALAGHPAIVAQIDTDFRLVTISSREPFGSDDTGTAASPPAAGAPLPGASTGPAASATAAATLSPGETLNPPIPGERPGGTALRSPYPIALQPRAARADLARAAQAAQSPAPEIEPQQVWQIQLADHTLKGALTRWAHHAGWQLVWDAPVDFSIDATATVDGTFGDALRAVIGSLSHSETPIQAILYHGNKVVRIVEKGAA